MRFLCLFAIATVMAAQSAIADPTGSPQAIAPAQVQLPYPAAAKAAGVDGQVILKCRRTEHSALTDCGLVVEGPTGLGFGAAALELAAKSADGCGPPLPPTARGPGDVRFSFHASSGAITPDVTRPGWLISHPHWVHLPSGDELTRYYPERAFRADVSGEATLQCIAAVDRHVSDCEVIQEGPEGGGFGVAALQLSPSFVIDPSTCDGQYVGSTVILPMRFNAP
jgi:hypothetical protein